MTYMTHSLIPAQYRPTRSLWACHEVNKACCCWWWGCGENLPSVFLCQKWVPRRIRTHRPGILCCQFQYRVWWNVYNILVTLITSQGRALHPRSVRHSRTGRLRQAEAPRLPRHGRIPRLLQPHDPGQLRERQVGLGKIICMHNN